MLRLTDLATGRSVDLPVLGMTSECFVEQLEAGKKPKGLHAFIERLSYRVELAIADAVDASIEPPRASELISAVYLASDQNLSLPPECLRRRRAMVKFLLGYARTIAADEVDRAPSDGSHQGRE